MSANHTYHTCVLHLQTKKITRHTAFVHSPVHALNEFHEIVQCRLNYLPDEYRLYDFEREGYSAYELPPGFKNPDLREKEPVPVVANLEFGFVPDIPSDAHLADWFAASTASQPQ